MKVQIIGGSGTGKSTLAKFISEKENIKWIDTDEYLWKDDSYTENNPIEKRLEMYQNGIQSTNNYVVSGSVFFWNPQGFGNRDLLVFLSLDEKIRMDRLRKREMKRNHISKMWLDKNGEYTNDFIEWCKTYLTEKNKSMAGTFASQTYEIEISRSPVLKLDSSCRVEDLYKEILFQLKSFQ